MGQELSCASPNQRNSKNKPKKPSEPSSIKKIKVLNEKQYDSLIPVTTTTRINRLECQDWVELEEPKRLPYAVPDPAKVNVVASTLAKPEDVELIAKFITTKHKSIMVLTIHLDKKNYDSALKLLTNNISKLPNLLQLDLRFDDFREMNSADLQKLAVFCASCVNLPALSLLFTECTFNCDEAMDKFWESLQKMSKLQLLSCHFRICLETEGKSIRKFSENIWNVEQLESLELEFEGSSCMDNHHLQVLSESLKKMKKLKNLSFNFNCCESLSRDGFNHLLSMLAEAHLESLCLKLEVKDQVEDVFIQLLCDRISKLEKLNTLQLYLPSNLTNKSITRLSKLLSTSSSIHTVKISLPNCHYITSVAWELLASSFNNNTLWLELDLQLNAWIDDDVVLRFCTEVTKLTNLVAVSIDFDFCNISKNIDQILLDTHKKLISAS
jgi:hypothetical protein